MNNIIKKGTLYGIGVGPGDPELMTIKAVKMINKIEVLALPGTAPKETVAYKIAALNIPDMDRKTLLEISTPMIKDRELMRKNHEEGARAIEKYLESGQDVAYLTIGDPTIYSTFTYIQKNVENDGYKTLIVNGIPSFCAAAAKANIPLVEWNERLHIIPSVHKSGDDNYVFMKSGRKIEEIKEIIAEKQLEKVVMVENCGMEGENIIEGVDKFPKETGYYTLIIGKIVTNSLE